MRRGVVGVVQTIEVDPNRSARISKVYYSDGDKKYIIAPVGLEIGKKIVSGADASLEVGNSMPLSKIPVGTPIHNIEINSK